MSNTVRPEEFGKDHGLIHEAVVTGRKVGADREFWATLAHNEEKFHEVVELVLGWRRTEKEWFYFTTTGQSIQEQVKRFLGVHIIIPENDPVCKQHGSAGRRLLIRLGAVPGSVGKSWDDQKVLLGKGEFVPKPWDLVDAAVAYKKATGQWPELFLQRLAIDRCPEILPYRLWTDAFCSDGCRIYIAFRTDGVDVDSARGEYGYSDLGLAVSRKVPELFEFTDLEVSAL